MTSYTLFNSATTTASTRTDGPLNIGLEVRTNQTCWLTGVRFRRPDTTSQTVQFQVWQMQNNAGTLGTLKASGTFSLGSTSGWKDFTFGTPLKMEYSATLTYQSYHRLCIRATRWLETTNYFTTGTGGTSRVVGPVTVPNKTDALGDMQCSYSTDSVNFITTAAAPSAQMWWMDMVISDVDPRVPRQRGSLITLGADN
jgi:hypothetical protein